MPTDAPLSVSVMRVGGRCESILIWDKEEDDFNVDEEDERMLRERWDEWLVLDIIIRTCSLHFTTV